MDVHDLSLQGRRGWGDSPNGERVVVLRVAPQDRTGGLPGPLHDRQLPGMPGSPEARLWRLAPQVSCGELDPSSWMSLWSLRSAPPGVTPELASRLREGWVCHTSCHHQLRRHKPGWIPALAQVRTIPSPNTQVASEVFTELSRLGRWEICGE